MSTPSDDDGIGLFSHSGGDGSDASRPARKRHWPRRLLISFIILIAVIVVAGGLYALSIDRSLHNNLNRANNMPPETPTAPGESPRPRRNSDDRSVNVVLIGSDSRDPSAARGRSDALMIIHLAGDRRSAYIISFPRDMYVNIPGRGKNKINAAYSWGGPALTVATLEQLTGVRMDHVAQVNFTGFINLTNTLGGVTIDNPHAFSAQGYDFPKGEITIQGKKALAFVQERHSLPNGDLDRAANQRRVVQAILAKGLSAGTITNPLKFTQFVSGVAQNVIVDNQLTDSAIRDLALSLRMTPGDVKQLQAPSSGFATVPGVGAVVLVDQAKMKELSRALRQDDVGAYVKKHPGG